jgi:hypothetical protein
VIIEHRDIEIPSGRQLPYLLPPRRKQIVPLAPNELRQFIEILVRHYARACI